MITVGELKLKLDEDRERVMRSFEGRSLARPEHRGLLLGGGG